MSDTVVEGNEVILIVEMEELNTFVVRKESIPTYASKDSSLSMYSDTSYYTTISGRVGEGEDLNGVAERELLRQVGVGKRIIKDIEVLQENVPLYKDIDTRVSVVYLTLKKPEVNVPIDGGIRYEDLTDSVLIGLEEWGEIIMGGNNYDVSFLMGYLIIKEKKR